MPVSDTERAEQGGSVFSLLQPLRGLIRRPPVVYPPDTPLRVALERMHRERIGSIVMADPDDMKPLGVVTFSDVLGRVVLAGGDLSMPLSQAIGPQLVTLAATATAHDAVLAMARGAVRYVLVVDAASGRLLGVVSRGDLYSTQRIASEDVVNAVISARSVGELAVAAAETRHFANRLVSQGLSAEQAMQWITSLNDLVGLQAIDLVKSRFELPEARWCWLAFGSEGRFEQTLATDQDNGLLFEAPPGADVESLRQAFLPFAQAVNQALDDCGFPLCRGQIMAGNPLWCLSTQEWRGRFAAWIAGGDPKALLNASIFFDFRALYGASELAAELRQWLLGETQASAIFQRLMALNALQCQPPLGLIRTFVLDRRDEPPNTIDLKQTGSRPYVDAARLYALANGIAATGTVERLRALSRVTSFGGDDLQAAIDGYLLVQRLRLANQQRCGGHDRAVNRINPYRLNALERRFLRDAFGQAKRLQQRLKADYRI